MKVFLSDATGMVEHGALREALQADDLKRVLAVVRMATGPTHPEFWEPPRGRTGRA